MATSFAFPLTRDERYDLFYRDWLMETRIQFHAELMKKPEGWHCPVHRCKRMGAGYGTCPIHLRDYRYHRSLMPRAVITGIS